MVSEVNYIGIVLYDRKISKHYCNSGHLKYAHNRGTYWKTLACCIGSITWQFIYSSITIIIVLLNNDLSWELMKKPDQIQGKSL